MPLWLKLLLMLSISCLLCWYISPYREVAPSKIQALIAKTWIIFRRIVSFTGAIFCFFIIFIIWEMDKSIEYRIWSSLAALGLSVFFVYVGVVGQGWNMYGFRDDISLYKKIKQKWNIRW